MKLVFKEDAAGEHLGPTYFQVFAPMSFGKLMVHLTISIWNACLFRFLAWLHPPFKKYFAGTD